MTLKTDTRRQQIKNWLDNIFATRDYRLDLASSDASFRRYFRVTMHDDQQTFIVMDAPPEKESTKLFADIATFLRQQDIHVPTVLAENNQDGFLLLTDFGNLNYLDALNGQVKPADHLYKAAIDSLIKLQTCPLHASLPHYSRALLKQETALFSKWFLGEHLGISRPHFINDITNGLIDNALAQPCVIVHRDYHSRNLMHTAKRSPGIIDFQDATMGPISYDLVSLLRDCYIALPDDTLTKWLTYYYQQARAQNLLADVSIRTLTRWFDLMGLQRHLKVLGIFCRLHHRDKKSGYMNDLPLVLHYVRTISARYPEYSSLADFINSHPKIAAI